MNLASFVASIALLLHAGAPIYNYGDNSTLNEGIVVLINGDFDPTRTDAPCTVIGYEQRGDPGYFIGEC